MPTAVREHLETVGHTLERQRVVTELFNGTRNFYSLTLPRRALLIGGFRLFNLGSVLLHAFCGVLLLYFQSGLIVANTPKAPA